MFRRLPMSQLHEKDMIRDHFMKGGYCVVVTSPEWPPVILLHPAAFYLDFHDYDDEADRKLLLKILKGPGLAATKIKEPGYLSLLCHYIQMPIRVTFGKPRFTIIALSLEEYNRRAKDNLKISEKAIKKVSEDNLRDPEGTNE